MRPGVHHTDSHHNLDVECSHQKMFRSDEAKNSFREYISNNCINNYECNIQLQEEIFKVNNKMVNLYELLSDKCYERIFEQGITSPELIAAISCTKDYIVFPLFESN